MRKVLFDDLLSKIRPQINRRNTNFRMSIGAGLRTVTLYLETGSGLVYKRVHTTQTGLDKTVANSVDTDKTRQDSLVLSVSTGAAPRFWKWGDKFCQRSEQKFFSTPTFWPLGDKILL